MAYIGSLMQQPPRLPASPPGGGSASQTTSLGGGRQLTLPWLDFASTALPDSHSLVLWWAQYLWLSDGNYRTAMERVIAHFITDLAFEDLTTEEKDVWRDILEKHIDYRAVLTSAGHDFLGYGNSLNYLYLPFRRSLVCGDCKFDQPIERVPYKVRFSTKDPYVTWERLKPCPRCGSMSPMHARDRRDRDMSAIRVDQVPPDEIQIAFNRWSGKGKYYWDFSAEDRRDVKSGVEIYVESTPIEVLEAIAAGQPLLMNPEVFLHSAEKTISGVKSRGWGVPRVLSNFRSAWLQQLTNKQDQASVIDYTLGMRVVSPATSSGGDDPMQNHAQDQFVSRMQNIIQSHRDNPVGIYTAPYPINYQFMGGEGSHLIPFEKMKARHQEYLSQLGVPLEYHQMNLSAQGAPMMIKLFENYWQQIPALFNNILQWIVGTVSRVYNLKPTRVTMHETTLAYDLERKHALLQLMAGQQVSAETALRPYGIDAGEEVRNVMRHQRMVARLHEEEEEHNMRMQEMGALRGLAAHQTPSQKLEEQMMAQEQAAAGGGVPPAMGGGMPIGGAGGVSDNSSLHAMSEQAMEEAHRLVSIPDDYTRRQELKMLRESNPDLHALVRSHMEKIRQQARSEGGQMLLHGQ